jgi:PAS domain S-box-containing protein
MDDELRTRLRVELLSRRHGLVDDWYRRLARTAYVALSQEELQGRLGTLVERAIDVLLSGSPVGAQAQGIGTALADLHLIRPEALAETIGTLGHGLSAGLPADDVAAIQPLLVELLSGISAGFASQMCVLMLEEQESVRGALLSELGARRAALEQAQTRLEATVVSRTSELRKTNEELEGEVERRRAVEDALRRSEERLRLLLSQSPDVVLTVDRSGAISYLNRVPDSSQWVLEDLIGRQALEFAAPEFRDSLSQAIGSGFDSGHSTYLEAQAITVDGVRRWFGTSLAPITIDGRVESVMMISRDITDRKQLDELKDQLIRDVSHELRTPLAKMQMSMELLLEMGGNEGASSQLMRLGQRTLHNVQRLLRTVEAILDLSALEAGVTAYSMQRIQLGDLLQDAVTDMEPLAWASGLELLLDVEPDLPSVEGDDEQLYRVMVNLIDNAVKYSDEGQVEVAARAHPDGVEVSVADSGHGILPENLEKVFERFFQEKSRFHGAGVGLSICRTIVQAHGGRIWAESSGRGQGATFRFRLPFEGEAR